MLNRLRFFKTEMHWLSLVVNRRRKQRVFKKGKTKFTTTVFVEMLKISLEVLNIGKRQRCTDGPE